jgi:GT2 family glycosyltransferase
VPWVTGCCFLVRRECLRQLGGFDEDYFLYYEDVDFCRRARQAGWEVWHDPSVRAVHHRPLHSRAVTAPIRLCTRHALLTYGAKHWPRWQFLSLAAIIKAEAWLRRRFAAWRGDAASAAQFRELAALVTDLARGRTAAARRRVSRIMAR